MGFKLHEASKVEVVNDFVTWMKGALEEARTALTKAKDNMAQYYNCRRTPAPCYKVGDHVFLDASDLRISCPSQKLAHCFLGPYEIVVRATCGTRTRKAEKAHKQHKTRKRANAN
jgi:hypothetical protein